MRFSQPTSARESPVITAYPVVIGNSLSLAIWCRHCHELHVHDYQHGHHPAGCKKPTPYAATGYNLAISVCPVPAEEVYKVASGDAAG